MDLTLVEKLQTTNAIEGAPFNSTNLYRYHDVHFGTFSLGYGGNWLYGQIYLSIGVS